MVPDGITLIRTKSLTNTNELSNVMILGSFLKILRMVSHIFSLTFEQFCSVRGQAF